MLTTRPRWLRSKTLLGGAALVAVLLAVALWPRRLPVDAAQVTRGPLTVTLDEEGHTRVRQRFVVASPVAGRLLRIDLEPGDAVRRGETLLARLLPADPLPLDARERAQASQGVEAARAASERAKAEVKSAAAAANLAAIDLERARQLVRNGIAAAQSLDTAEATARATEAAHRAALFAADAAGHELAMARARLEAPHLPAGEPVEIRAPVDGVVLRRWRESESALPAGEPLLELGDPASLEIVADYLSSDAVRIAAGQRVEIEQWGGPEVLQGIVRRVEPAGFTKTSALGVEEQRVNVIVDFVEPDVTVAERQALGDGFRVETRIVIWHAADVLRIPMSALFRTASSSETSDEAWSTFEIVKGRARTRSVTLGPRNDLEAQVLGGLAEGAAVVLHPPDTLRDGGRVRIGRVSD